MHLRGQGEYIAAIAMALIAIMFSYLAIQWVGYLTTIGKGVEEEVAKLSEKLAVVYPYNGNLSQVLIVNEWSGSSIVEGFIVLKSNGTYTYLSNSLSLPMNNSTVTALPAKIGSDIYRVCVYTQHLNMFCNNNQTAYRSNAVNMEEVESVVRGVSSCTVILSKLLPDAELFNTLSMYYPYNCSYTQLPLQTDVDPFIGSSYRFYRLPYVFVEYSFLNGVINYNVKGDGTTWSVGSISYSSLSPPTSLLLASRRIEYGLGVAKLVYTVNVYVDVVEKGVMRVGSSSYRYVKAVTKLEIRQFIEGLDSILAVSKRGYSSGYSGDSDTASNEYYLLKAVAGSFTSQYWALRGYRYYDNGWSIFTHFNHIQILDNYYAYVKNWQTPSLSNQWGVKLVDPQAYNISKNPSYVATIGSHWGGNWLAGYSIPSTSVQSSMAEAAKYIIETQSQITFTVLGYDFSYSPPYRVEFRPWLRYEGDNTLYIFLLKKYK
jgi:hypothetical protein